jgi:hypothetical protein
MPKRDPDEVNIIYIKWLSALPALILTAGAAVAQDFTAGKTPAQLFGSDCSTCHHQPNGLGKKYDTGSLAGFLRAHYTTKPASAGALAKYVMEFASLPSVRTTSPTGEEVDPKGRRRTSDVSGDGEKPSRSRPTGNAPSNAPSNAPGNAPGNEEPPKPPAAIVQPAPAVEAAVQPPAAPRSAAPARGRSVASESSPPVAKLNDYAHSGAPVVSREPADPISRIRAYATSGAGPDEAAAEAPKPASGKPHHRSDSGAPSEAAAPTAPDAPADPNAAPAPAAGSAPSTNSAAPGVSAR